VIVLKVYNCKGNSKKKINKKINVLYITSAELKKLKKYLIWMYLKKIITIFTRDYSINQKITSLKNKILRLEKKIYKLESDINSLEKGQAGERLVSDSLFEELDENYYLLNNFDFVWNGVRWEIDHLIISSSCLFLVETKNMKGRIFVEDDGKKWFKTPINKPDKLKTPMDNPQHQLKRTYRALKSLMESQSSLTEVPVKLAVVFPRNSCLLVGMSEEGLHLGTKTLDRIENITVPLLYHDELTDFIKSRKAHTGKMKIDEVFDYLIKLRHNHLSKH